MVRRAFEAAPIDLTFGGWGQDGHIAHNQARRHPYSHIALEEFRCNALFEHKRFRYLDSIRKEKAHTRASLRAYTKVRSAV